MEEKKINIDYLQQSETQVENQPETQVQKQGEQKKQRRALALFSGGLDSILACKLVMDQGVDVIGINFVSHFFGGLSPITQKIVDQLKINVQYEDIKSIHTDLVKNPPNGRGKNMNPCIDCHGLMFNYTMKHLMKKYDADFVISGEVMGQRPFSQNKQALNTVKLLAGDDEIQQLVVRPLSQKLLQQSKPEIEGWIDREKLLDISGRSRKRQQDLILSYGIKEYPSSGGGCVLTAIEFSNKLKLLEDDGFLDNEHACLFYLIKYGRLIRPEPGKLIIVARSKEENDKLQEYKEWAFKQKGQVFIQESEKEGQSVAGPTILGYGKEFNEEDKKLVMKLFCKYCKIKGKGKAPFIMDGELKEFEIENLAEFDKYIDSIMFKEGKTSW